MNRSRISSGLWLIAVCAALFVGRQAEAQRWIAKGPAPVTGGQVEGLGAQNSPVVGAVQAILPSPTNANLILVGAVNGGIWRTTNATNSSPTWSPTSDFATSLSISTLQFDPTDASSNTAIAGVGRYSSLAHLGGVFTGLLTSANGGQTWTQQNSLATKEVSGVAERGTTILASIDFANSFTYGNIGIFRSTNNGASFAQISGNGPTVNPNGLYGGRAFTLAADPTNNNVFYTSIRDAAANDGVYRSADAGATWSRVGSAALTNLFSDGSGGTGDAKITVGNAGQVYVGVVNAGKLAGLFRASNPTSAASWTQLDTPATIENGTSVGVNPDVDPNDPPTVAEIGSSDVSGGQGNTNMNIVADPNNANLVYVAGDRQPSQLNGSGQETGFFPNSIGANNYSGRLFRVDASQAAGSQATPITNNFTSSGSSPHADSRALAFDANGNLIETDDGGIYKRASPTTSSGAWAALVGNLQVAEIHSIAYDDNCHTLLAGTQDIGTAEQATSAATSWRTVAQGDGGKVAVDNHTAGSSVRYNDYVFLQNFERRTFNSAGNLTGTSFPGLNVVGVGQPVNHKNSSGNFDVDAGIQFYNPIAVNTVNGDFLTSGRYVYESTDGGVNLNRLGDLGSGNHVVALAGGGSGGSVNASLLYAVGTGKTFARRLAGNPSDPVTLVTSYSSAANADPTALAISSKDWHDLFASDPTQVFESTDAGGSFSNISGNLGTLEKNVHTLAEITFNSVEYILAGGDNGVFLSGGPGGFGTWAELGASTLPNAPVMDLKYDATDNVLVAGTLGRGAWEIPNFSNTLSTLVPEPATLSMFGPGSAAILLAARRRKTRARRV